MKILAFILIIGVVAALTLGMCKTSNDSVDKKNEWDKYLGH